ncbi:hypothetical protein ACOSP7_004492 [Xanthoceras sorbifolium]
MFSCYSRYFKNFLLWCSQVAPLIRSLGVYHYLTSDEKPSEETVDDEEEVSIMIFSEAETTYEIWNSIEEQKLPITVEKEGFFKYMLMSLSKWSRTLDEYLKEFKSIFDNLAAIKKPISDRDKVLQFAHGLGSKYIDFRTAMLTKPHYHSFSQFT